jgi:hypothetical protein
MKKAYFRCPSHCARRVAGDERDNLQREWI